MPDRNGANRGGARPGAGRKKKPLSERIEAGQKATVLKIPEVETAQMPKLHRAPSRQPANRCVLASIGNNTQTSRAAPRL